MVDNAPKIAGEISGSRTKPATHGARIILVSAALLLPTLSLLPFGAMYLWQQGWMLWWALGALGLVGAVTLWQHYLLSTPPRRQPPAAVAEFGVTRDPSGAPMSPAEQSAWEDVRRIADTVVVEELTSVQALVDLGQQTVDAGYADIVDLFDPVAEKPGRYDRLGRNRDIGRTG